MNEEMFGYGRVSAKDQNEALQKFGVIEKNIFIDKKSGKNFDREQYKLIKMLLDRNKNGVLVVESIDRLGRDLIELYNKRIKNGKKN